MHRIALTCSHSYGAYQLLGGGGGGGIAPLKEILEGRSPPPPAPPVPLPLVQSTHTHTRNSSPFNDIGWAIQAKDNGRRPVHSIATAMVFHCCYGGWRKVGRRGRQHIWPQPAVMTDKHEFDKHNTACTHTHTHTHTHIYLSIYISCRGHKRALSNFPTVCASRHSINLHQGSIRSLESTSFTLPIYFPAPPHSKLTIDSLPAIFIAYYSGDKVHLSQCAISQLLPQG